jgi:hypothetical protein
MSSAVINAAVSSLFFRAGHNYRANVNPETMIVPGSPMA